ncbi:hypothetical protein KY284_008389 [Solanum tuberosum]|nr:hypothetical protein KY284_008389 [Solanum tuberosum]
MVLFLLKSVLVVVAIFSISSMAQASDPDILTDFIVPVGSAIDGNLFTFNGTRAIFGSVIQKFSVTKVGKTEFPVLDGQSVSLAVLQFPRGSVNLPHTHPRAAELLFVVEGTLEVGFVDTTNKLYTQTLKVGDLFVFPKGLMHYQYNSNRNELATAVSGFGSANAGTVSLPTTLFATGIDDQILAKSFKSDIATIQKIKAGLSP